MDIGRFVEFLDQQVEDILHARGKDFGWMDGGCQILADAMVTWGQGALIYGAILSARQDTWRISHVFVRDRNTGLAIDGDGASASEDELLGRLLLFRGEDAPIYRIGFYSRADAINEGKIERSLDISRVLVSGLIHEFGTYSSEMFQVPGTLQL